MAKKPYTYTSGGENKAQDAAMAYANAHKVMTKQPNKASASRVAEKVTKDYSGMSSAPKPSSAPSQQPSSYRATKGPGQPSSPRAAGAENITPKKQMSSPRAVSGPSQPSSARAAGAKNIKYTSDSGANKSIHKRPVTAKINPNESTKEPLSKPKTRASKKYPYNTPKGKAKLSKNSWAAKTGRSFAQKVKDIFK